MAAPTTPIEVLELLQVLSTAFQICTALIAVSIAVMTFRYTKRQSALTLINHNNQLANLVNSTIINSEEAREALGKLQSVIVGCPDDAVLFMYLNYVHNTYRMRRIGAVSPQVWKDTLASCVKMVSRLRREQLVLLLSRGYEGEFQSSVLARFDTTRGAPAASSSPRSSRCAARCS